MTNEFSGYDAWKTSTPVDETETEYVGFGKCEECGTEDSDICEWCGNCIDCCPGHDMDEIEADMREDEND